MNVSMARARQSRARAILGVANAPAGAKAPAAATIAAAATWPDFSDGNLGPDFEAAGPDDKAAGPDNKAAGPDNSHFFESDPCFPEKTFSRFGGFGK